MAVNVISTADLSIYGGMQTWVKDIQEAVKGIDSDLNIITDDKALYKADLTSPFIYYLTTPRRSLYDMYYFSDLKYRPIIPLLRLFDRHVVRSNVRNFLCISQTVRNRINKVYQMNAGVIYPCIYTEKYICNPPEGYWLSVQRMDKWKRIDLQIEIFKKLPNKRLVIAGPMFSDRCIGLVKDLPENVEYIGPVNENRLLDLYSRCNGVVCTSIDEDFGIVPLEAMASNKPVLAVYEGGYRETVVHGETGMLCDPTPEFFKAGLLYIERNPNRFCSSRERALQFDFKKFKENLERYIRAIQ